MQSVESTVCDNFESGTDHKVWIRFKSTKSNSSCRTDVLDGPGNSWGRGNTDTWGYECREDWDHNYLGSCAQELRRFPDDLEFRVELLDFQFHIVDDVEICRLRVTFGSKDEKRSNTWEWSRADGPPGEGAWKKGCLTCKISVQISLRRWRVLQNLALKPQPPKHVWEAKIYQNLSPAEGWLLHLASTAFTLEVENPLGLRGWIFQCMLTWISPIDVYQTSLLGPSIALVKEASKRQIGFWWRRRILHGHLHGYLKGFLDGHFSSFPTKITFLAFLLKLLF